MVNSEGKPFVVLRSLDQGNVFWSTSKLDDDPTKLVDGTVAYAVIGYCDTDTEAKELYSKHADPNALSDYIYNSYLRIGYDNEQARQQTDELVGLLNQPKAH